MFCSSDGLLRCWGIEARFFLTCALFRRGEGRDHYSVYWRFFLSASLKFVLGQRKEQGNSVVSKEEERKRLGYSS